MAYNIRLNLDRLLKVHDQHFFDEMSRYLTVKFN
jgi:hypothetical protein